MKQIKTNIAHLFQHFIIWMMPVILWAMPVAHFLDIVFNRNYYNKQMENRGFLFAGSMTAREMYRFWYGKDGVKHAVYAGRHYT